MTGAAGFIGVHLLSELRRHEHIVYGVDRDSFDLLEPDAFRNYVTEIKPDVVIHLAAQVGREFGEDDLMHTVMSNAGITTVVANVCGDFGIRLMYASTSEVYGDWGEWICDEDEPFRRIPHNLYGLSKRWGEEACRLYASDSLTVMRFSMPYGPGLPAGRGRAALINFLYNALHGDKITVHRNSERAWCWIGDTVRAVRLLMEGGHTGAFNIGRDDNALPMRSVAEKACDLAGAPHSLIVDVDAPARQTVVKRLATEKIRSIGWKPEVDLDEGMARTFEYVKGLPKPVDHARLIASYSSGRE